MARLYKMASFTRVIWRETLQGLQGRGQAKNPLSRPVFHPPIIRPLRNFDHNATHPLCPAAREAWLDAVERLPSNPSSPHRWGGRASAALDDARDRIARWLGCPSHEVVFTSGATESNNAVVRHLAATTQGVILVSAIEHPSVRAAVRHWLPGRSEVIPALQDGRSDADWVVERIRRGGVEAVVLMAANNETGVLQPFEPLREACARRGVTLAVDAAQWVGKLPMNRLSGIPLLAACAHKFGGPQGVGFLRCPAHAAPWIVGGPQENGRRAGTENVPGVLAMVAALGSRESLLGPIPSNDAVAIRQAWRDAFIQSLQSAVPGVEILGSGTPRLWNTVAALMPPARDCRRRWVARLDRLGVAASTGSACSSGKEEPSHVLVAMGLGSGASDRMLRFSAGWETTGQDWTALLEAVQKAASDLLDGK